MINDSPRFRRDWEPWVPQGSCRVTTAGPCRHRDLNTHAEGRYLWIWAAESCAGQALTWAAAAKLGFEDYLVYSGKQPRTDILNSDDLNATLLIPSHPLQILQLCLQIPFSAVLCEYNQYTERTSRSGSKYSSNPQALTAYASFGKKTPTPGRRQYELANGATLPQPIYPGSDFCSAQMYAVQTSSSGSEISRVSSICSLVNLVCGNGSVNNFLKKGKNRQMNRFSHPIERKFPPNHPLWISQPSGQTHEQQAGRKQRWLVPLVQKP